MNRTSAWVFVAVVATALPSIGAATAIKLPDDAALKRGESAFELCPGVIADPVRGKVYLMSPQGGIEQVSVATGEVLWTTTRADKPLAVWGDLLIAQAERADSGVLEIVVLDAFAGGELQDALPIALPAGVRGLVDEEMGRSLAVRAAVREDEPWVSWEYTERDIRGVAPADEPLQRKQIAHYRLDVSAGRAVAVDVGSTAAAAVPLPANVVAWEASGEGSIAVTRVDGVFAATQAQRQGGSARIMLRRWDAVSGEALPEVDLFSRPHVLQFASADGRHLLVAEHTDPGQFREYEWSIFSLATGERLGLVSHHLSHAWFFVTGEALVYVEPPYGRREGDMWVDEPRRVKAILLGSAFPVWARQLRDTIYRGPFPP